MTEPYSGYNGDLLPAAIARALEWEKTHDYFFSPSKFVDFATRSKLAPQLAEPFFLEEVVFPLAAKTKSKKQLLIPRKHTKSSIAKALACFLLVDYESHQWGRQVRINLMGETKSFAIRTTKAVRMALETNTYILKTYGRQRPSKELTTQRAAALVGDEGDPEGISPPEWTQSKFRTATCVDGEIETGIVNEEPSMWAGGADVSSTGEHMDVLMFDDFVGENSFKSPVKKEKAISRYKDKEDQLMSTGWLLDIGTVWAEEDIHHHIQENHHESFDFVIHTIWGNGPELEKEDFEKGEDGIWRVVGPKAKDAQILWEGFEQLTDEVRTGVRPDPVKRREMAFHHAATIMLENKKGDAGGWAKQYLNRCIATEDQLFHDWMFKSYNINGLPRHIKYILTDSATGTDNRSSYRVVATVGLDTSDCAYVIDLDFGRWSPSDYADKILEHWARYNPRRLFFEKVAWQDAFKTIVDLKCKISGMVAPKVVDIPGRSLVSKLERMEGLEPRLRNGRMLFNPKLKEKECDGKNVWQETVAQFRRVHEQNQVKGLLLDIPDALSDIDCLDLNGKRLCKPAKGIRQTSGQDQSIRAKDVMEPLTTSRKAAREDANSGGDLWGGVKRSPIPKPKQKKSLW